MKTEQRDVSSSHVSVSVGYVPLWKRLKVVLKKRTATTETEEQKENGLHENRSDRKVEFALPHK
ncbi:MAG: hypothetical protein IJ191_01635 [Treponema sp.]|nr:hypothetical protein [Treponema sp.]